MIYLDEKVIVWRRHYFKDANPDLFLDLLGSDKPIPSKKSRLLWETAEPLNVHSFAGEKRILYVNESPVMENYVTRKKFLESMAELVCLEFRISLKEFLSPSRKVMFVDARKAFACLAKELNFHVNEVASTMNRDRCSVMHLSKTALDLYDAYPSFKKSVDRLRLLITTKKEEWKTIQQSLNASAEKRVRTEMANLM